MAKTASSTPRSKRPATGDLNATLYASLFPPSLSKSDLRKMQILDAAIETYAKIGVEYVSHEDLAREAKISRPLLQHHFPDKNALFQTAIRFVRARMQKLAVDAITTASGADPDPQAVFAAYIKASFNWARNNPSHMKTWLFFFYQCMGNKELRAFHTEMTSMGRDRIISMIKAGHKKGIYAGGDFERKAFQIQQLITGGLVEVSVENGRTFDELIESTTRLVTALLQTGR